MPPVDSTGPMTEKTDTATRSLLANLFLHQHQHQQQRLEEEALATNR
jgi:hypothetical protein